MGSDLREIGADAFRQGLEQANRKLGQPSPEPAVTEKLHAHYEELRRWNRTVALVGPAMAGEALEQHYAESLAGHSLIPADARTLVDVGSGAGFPGLILAASGALHATLIEARERKAAFLAAAARRMALQVSCLNARVESLPPTGLPAQIDVVTMRAVRLSPSLLEPLLSRLSTGGRILLWCSGVQEVPSTLEPTTELPLLGQRRIAAFRIRG